MIQNAGLVFGDGISSFVLAHMLTMAGEKDGWIGLQETSDSRVEHRWEGVANGLSCQTKCAFRHLRRLLDEWHAARRAAHSEQCEATGISGRKFPGPADDCTNHTPAIP